MRIAIVHHISDFSIIPQPWLPSFSSRIQIRLEIIADCNSQDFQTVRIKSVFSTYTISLT